MKEAVALVRKHAPTAKIVLGGYGTVLDDMQLAPYGDHICREEGVAWFRALLGEPPRPMPYDHPLVTLKLRVFSILIDRTGVILPGWAARTAAIFVARRTFLSGATFGCFPLAMTSSASSSAILRPTPA